MLPRTLTPGSPLTRPAFRPPQGAEGAAAAAAASTEQTAERLLRFFVRQYFEHDLVDVLKNQENLRSDAERILESLEKALKAQREALVMPTLVEMNKDRTKTAVMVRLQRRRRQGQRWASNSEGGLWPDAAESPPFLSPPARRCSTRQWSSCRPP